MAVVWHCDICKKETWVNPESEVEMREVEELVELPCKVVVEENGEKVVREVTTKQKVIKKIPQTTSMYRQNFGRLEKTQVPKLKYKNPKTIIVQLRAGDETLQKDFCEECYHKYLGVKVKALWDELAKIESV